MMTCSIWLGSAFTRLISETGEQFDILAEQQAEHLQHAAHCVVEVEHLGLEICLRLRPAAGG
jgi:hypothetical protein